MKTYTFALPDDEAETLDATIQQMQAAWPDLTPEDALIAIIRLGWEQVGTKLQQWKPERTHPCSAR